MSRTAIALFLAAISCCGSVSAQDKSQKPTLPSSSCSRENALTIVQQQIDLTKTIDDDVRRITVLLRAADLIWPY
ncbi:MAG: hypothetical protein ABR556_12705, partial [Pyrinomonadaceae bacterium]